MYKLLTVNGNAKIEKGNNLSDKFWACIMHLRPINTKICPFQNIAKCKAVCLDNSGLARVYPTVHKARDRKTKLFLDDRETFMQQLYSDIEKFIRACDRKGKKPAIRLNGTSDIQWETIKVDGTHVFDKFPEVQFYDYTKIPNRKVEGISNYHLTWSYSEANEKYAKYFDSIPYNTAVVFRKDLPKTFKGVKVIDGDKSDMRFLDESNSIVGLIAKAEAKTDESGFVIDS